MPAVTPWLHRPDGLVLERLEWLTDVITSFDAAEQRIALREFPRRGFEFAVGFSGRSRRLAENLLHQWQAQPWALPVWMDTQPLAAPLSIGATSITCDTDTRAFVDGGLLCLTSAPDVAEVLEIDTVASGAITLAEPTTKAWAAGAELLPACMARMEDEVALRRFTGDTSYGTLRWACDAPAAWPPASGGTTYRSHPVLTDAPNWVEDPEQVFARKVARLDPGVGPVYVDEEGAGAAMLQSHRWLLDGRAAIDGFRRWLYARRGRLAACWVPTFAQDLQVVATIGSAATTVDVEHCGYSASIAQAIGRRDVRIVLADGSAFHRRITGSSVVSAAVERLTIDSALGVEVAPAAVAFVSFMDLMRLNGDAVELAWWRSDVAEAALQLRGSQNNL